MTKASKEQKNLDFADHNVKGGGTVRRNKHETNDCERSRGIIKTR